MPHPRHHSLLDGPGIWTIAQHFQVVVRFEHQYIASAQRQFRIRRHVAEVSRDANLDAFRGKHEPYGVSGIMRNGERCDGNIADGKGPAGGEKLDRRQCCGISGRGGSVGRVTG